jgi:hypothetical protein
MRSRFSLLAEWRARWRTAEALDGKLVGAVRGPVGNDVADIKLVRLGAALNVVAAAIGR